jgi:hypothetical protein
MDATESMTDLQKLYLESMSDKEKKAYEIAKDHLGMSFQIEKSIGYINFIKYHTTIQQ